MAAAKLSNAVDPGILCAELPRATDSDARGKAIRYNACRDSRTVAGFWKSRSRAATSYGSKQVDKDRVQRQGRTQPGNDLPCTDTSSCAWDRGRQSLRT